MELGLAEFVARLLSEVVDGVLASLMAQELKHDELRAASRADLEGFSERFVSADDLEGELSSLFPDPEGQRPHSIYPGALYQPPSEGVVEFPPVEKAMGIRLQKGDFVVPDRGVGITLSEPGVQRIKEAAAAMLARRRMGALRSMVNRGVPRVFVDSGRISAKVTHRLLRTGGEEGLHLVMVPESNKLPLAPDLLKDVRVVVRQADEKARPIRGSREDRFGEVEITFKIVT